MRGSGAAGTSGGPGSPVAGAALVGAGVEPAGGTAVVAGPAGAVEEYGADDSFPITDIDDILPGIFTTGDLHFGRNPEMLSRARYAAIPKSGNRKNLRDKWYTVDERHGIQIFDLTHLRNVVTPKHFAEDAHYDLGSIHDIVVNNESGFVYAVGVAIPVLQWWGSRRAP